MQKKKMKLDRRIYREKRDERNRMKREERSKGARRIEREGTRTGEVVVEHVNSESSKAKHERNEVSASHDASDCVRCTGERRGIKEERLVGVSWVTEDNRREDKSLVTEGKRQI